MNFDKFAGLSIFQKMALGLVMLGFFIGMILLLTPFFGGLILGALLVSAVLASVMGAIGLGLIHVFNKLDDTDEEQYNKIVLPVFLVSAAIFIILNLIGVLPILAIVASTSVLIFFGLASIATFIGMYFLPKTIAQTFYDFGFEKKDIAIFATAVIAVIVLALVFAAGPFIGFLGAAMATLGGGLVGLLAVTAIGAGFILIAANILGLAKEAIELHSPLSKQDTKLDAIMRRMQREMHVAILKKMRHVFKTVSETKDPIQDYGIIRNKLTALIGKNEDYPAILADMPSSDIIEMLSSYDECGKYIKTTASQAPAALQLVGVVNYLTNKLMGSHNKNRSEVVEALNQLITDGIPPLAFLLRMKSETLATLVNQKAEAPLIQVGNLPNRSSKNSVLAIMKSLGRTSQANLEKDIAKQFNEDSEVELQSFATSRETDVEQRPISSTFPMGAIRSNHSQNQSSDREQTALNGEHQKVGGI